MPASVRTLTAVPPPAPEPITTTSKIWGVRETCNMAFRLFYDGRVGFRLPWCGGVLGAARDRAGHGPTPRRSTIDGDGNLEPAAAATNRDGGRGLSNCG